MRLTARSGLAVLATFAANGGAFAGVNLVTNGSFEQGFSGWTVPPNMPPGPNGANFQTPTDSPHSGLRYAQLSSTQLLFISQGVQDTVPGTDYVLEFWARYPGIIPATLVVRWEGQAVFHPQIGGGGQTTWSYFSTVVTSNFVGSNLEFGQNVFPGEIHIDSISVRQVPSPSALPLMALGGLVAVRRRRR